MDFVFVISPRCLAILFFTYSVCEGQLRLTYLFYSWLYPSLESFYDVCEGSFSSADTIGRTLDSWLFFDESSRYCSYWLALLTSYVTCDTDLTQ